MGNEIAKKLLLHKAKQALIMNEPDGYLDTLLGHFPENVCLVKESSDPVDFVHLFVKDISELNQFLGSALKVLKKDGLFWISYPKKSSKVKSDLNRDILVSILRRDGYEGVSLISIDETWSAMRVKPVREN